MKNSLRIIEVLICVIENKIIWVFTNREFKLYVHAYGTSQGKMEGVMLVEQG